MRKSLFSIGLMALLSACAADGSLTPTAVNTLKSACLIDGVAQPIVVMVGGAVATVAGFGPEAALAAEIDNKAAHPAVQAACSALGGTTTSAAASK